MSVSPVLVDSSVILDVATNDATSSGWSTDALTAVAATPILVINPIVYAEVSIGYARIEELDAALPLDIYRREPLPWPAGFLAGKAFHRYRRGGGTRRSPLPDFYVGAHAAIAGYRVLTRDPTRGRTYFPGVELITP